MYAHIHDHLHYCINCIFTFTCTKVYNHIQLTHDAHIYWIKKKIKGKSEDKC